MAADASPAAANPAGMTLLDRSQLLIASGAMRPSTNFDIAPQSTTSGGGGGNAGVFTPIGGFFYVYKLSEPLRLRADRRSRVPAAVNHGNLSTRRTDLAPQSVN